jgi:hypothetical protein
MTTLSVVGTAPARRLREAREHAIGEHAIYIAKS